MSKCTITKCLYDGISDKYYLNIIGRVLNWILSTVDPLMIVWALYMVFSSQTDWCVL